MKKLKQIEEGELRAIKRDRQDKRLKVALKKKDVEWLDEIED